MQGHYQLSIATTAILFLSLLIVTMADAQDDRQQILATRQASKLALRSYDHERVLSYLTEDILTTTGNGTLLSGKEALRKYILAAGDSKMYWIRTSNAIEINEKLGLAWENGTWKGYDPSQGGDPVVGGNYAAMWTRITGVWQIKSQLFVALE